jgi:hypothetical protein
VSAFFEQPGNCRTLLQQPSLYCSVTFTSPSGHIEIGLIENLSVRGAGILAAGHYSPGTIIQIHVPADYGEAATFLLAEVRHASARDEGWLIRCVFDRPLTVRMLSAFR